MRRSFRHRLREAVPTMLLAAVIYLPLLVTAPGRVGADTKTYLYLDPGRMLSRAVSMWDPSIGLGTVTHQNIGYLWPIGPFYWLAETAGLPDWVAQRLWLGSIMFLAGVGVRYLLNALGQYGPQVTAASFVYALTPYVLTLGARISVILLPYAGLPWLVAFTALALRRKGWRYPALFALTVATVGGVNATALLLAGLGPALWVVHAVLVAREVHWKRAGIAVVRIGVLTLACSLWWISGLYAQSAYGIDILRFTETAATVATASMAPEVLRGLGYWFFYGEDRFGPWIAPSKTYTQKLWLLAVTYLLPVLGLAGAAVARFRDRAFFAALVVTGTFLAVGGHPWDDPPPAGRAVKAFLLSDTGLAMRSLPRAAPLIVLGLSVLLGSGLAALAARRPPLARPAAAGVMALAVLGLPPLWTGKMVDENLDRPEAIPAYWRDAIRYLDGRSHETRVLEVPGADFASYRWGTTVDPITPGLMDRPFVARELIPYGSAPSADLLNAFDRQMQEGTLDPAAVAPLARFLGVGDINVRSDLTFERYNTPRPRLLWELLTRAPGLERPIGFGGRARNVPRPSLPLIDEAELLTPPSAPDPPKVAAIGVSQPEPIVRLAGDRPVVLAGNGEGMVDAASAGLLSGHELVHYSGSFAADPDGLRRLVDRDAALVLTDTNRREGRRWSTLRDNRGDTERAGQDPLRDDPRDQRLELFPDAGDDAFTVTESRGDVWAEATSYGNGITYTPEDRAANAVDGDPLTAWREGGFQHVDDESIRIHYRRPVTTDRLRFVQALGGVRNRFITEVAVRFDGGDPVTLALDVSSRDSPGQVVALGEARTFTTLEVEVIADDVGRRNRYDGLSAVGFSEIDAVPGDPRPPTADDVIRLPVDLLDAAGARSVDNPLSVVLTRDRTVGTNALRSDAEGSLLRSFALPTARSFGLSGRARLSDDAADDQLDRALGLPDAAAGGVVATSKRRLPGGLANRASAAVDGDLSTWYSPGFLGQNGEQVRYELPAPITFDHMDLTVLNDGRHSVPRRLVIRSGGEVVARAPIPDIADQPTPNGHATVRVQLPAAVTGRDLTFAVDDGPDAIREVTTLDWYTSRPVVMPIGLVELGVPGLSIPPPAGTIDGRCRSGLLTVDGQDVPLRLIGTVADLEAGRAVEVRTCQDAPVPLDEGQRTLRAVPGRATGIDLDQLVLRSAAGGTADPAAAAVPAAPAAAAARVTSSSRTAVDVEVPAAGRGGWLVLGQSHNLGWKATADGRDLGEPALVNGYANAWRVPAGAGAVRVRLEWTPQKVVWGALAASALAVLACLAALVVTRRRPRPDHDAEERIPGRDAAMPAALRASRVLRYAGYRPSIATTAVATAATFAVSWAVIGPAPALALATVTALGTRVARSRPLLTVGSPALLVLSAAFIIVRQWRRLLPAGFDWPTYFEAVHQVAWAAVALLLLDVVIDRLWLRRWWPSEESAP